MIKVLLLAILCVLTFVSCGEKNTEKTDEINKNISAVYSWGSMDEDLMKTASVSLMNDGTFSFGFSPISSYIGYGRYTMDNGKLVLSTSDGKYTYTFDIGEDCIIFDGENSSDMTWYSDFTDGAVFVESKLN